MVEETQTIPSERTLGAFIDNWLSIKRTKVEAGELVAKSYDNLIDCINYYGNWLGRESAVTSIDANIWQNYWTFLNGKVKTKTWSRDYASKIFRAARSFVEYAVSMGAIPLPPNLHSRELRFGASVRAVETMSVDEVRRLVANATGQLKLHLLLMINTGMQQSDIADLQHREVDWIEGRIIRKRSKTEDRDVPTVDYKLWPVTFALLEQYKTSHAHTSPELVLVTKSGSPWVWDKLKDDGNLGALSSSDNIATNYSHLKRKLKFEKPLKLLRKTSPSLLEGHDEYWRYSEYFLGHAPKSIKDKHYIKPSREQFDKAVCWLGEWYGFIEKVEGR